MRRLIRLFALAAALLAASCVLTQPPAPVTGMPPRLVVVIVVDGLPQRQVVDYRDQIAPDGLERFFTRGAWFTEAHYGHAVTETGPGHATILTGATPSRTGIVANVWTDPGTQARTYCFGDPDATYIGHRTGRLAGTSPKNLLVETLGDVMRRVEPRSKVIAISAKDRAAIATAGRQGTAYIYREESGAFASTTYYMKAHPQWVTDFNAGKPAERYLGAEWKPLLAEGAYARSLPDERKWFAPSGKLPMKLPGQAGKSYYEELMATPFGDHLTLAFARAALAGEALGRDPFPDLLIVSLSTHDYVNHGYGAESRLSHDHLLYLDRELQDFFNDLDVAVGRDNYVALLTADHGFTPAPEHSQSLGRDAGRVDPAKLIARLNTALAARFGPGRWALGWSADALVLNRVLARTRNAALDDVANAARALLLAEPGVAAAFTRAEIEGGARAGEPLLEAVRKSWHPARSADVHVILKPYWLMSSGTTSTSHGSPHAYDTNVPLLMYGPSWIAPGRIDRRVEITDIAPTLARLLGVPPPAGSMGKPLPFN